MSNVSVLMCNLKRPSADVFLLWGVLSIIRRIYDASHVPRGLMSFSVPRYRPHKKCKWKTRSKVSKRFKFRYVTHLVDNASLRTATTSTQSPVVQLQSSYTTSMQDVVPYFATGRSTQWHSRQRLGVSRDVTNACIKYMTHDNNVPSGVHSLCLTRSLILVPGDFLSIEATYNAYSSCWSLIGIVAFEPVQV